MPDVSFSGLAIVTAFAFAIPLVPGFAPRVRLPALLSVLIFPLVALTLIPKGEPIPDDRDDPVPIEAGWHGMDRMQHPLDDTPNSGQ